MPYTVVGAPALAFDLARLHGGDQVSGVLRTALAAGPDDLERLSACHPGTPTRSTWQRVRDDATVLGDELTGWLGEALSFAGEALDQAAGGETKLLRRLETGLLGDAHALDRLIRRELLDWTWLHSGQLAVQDPIAAEAADVLADAALGGYLRDRLPEDARRAMAVPFLRAGVPSRDATVPTGVPEVDEVLAVLAGADEGVRRRWRQAVDELRTQTVQWAPAMHQATWALSLTERLRPACDAQLAGVIAFGRAGFTARDAAYGVWNAFSGVLQASAVGDLLSAPEADVLLRPWRMVYA